MRNSHRALLAGTLSLAVAFVAGCGGSGTGLLTGSQASALQDQLNQVSSALSAGHCADVQAATRSLANQVASLPDTVSSSLRQALTGEANQVSSLSVTQCHPATSTSTTPATTPTTTSTTTPTTSTHTNTTPTTPTTTNTNTTPTTPTTPATTPTTPGTNSGGGGLSGGAGGGVPGTGGGANSNGNGNGQ